MAGDLNLKKSWNPALIKNQKKIWQEEQDKLQEYKKIQEKNKELQKEDEFRTMLKLQHGDDFDKATLTANEKLKLNKLNWMYEGPAGSNSEGTVNSAGFIEKEEFTKGKEQVENMLNGSRYVRKNQNNGSGGNNLARIISSGVSSSGAARSDDPLSIIKSQQRKVRESKHRESSRSRHSTTRPEGDSHRSSHRSTTGDRRDRVTKDRDSSRYSGSHRHSDSHREKFPSRPPRY